MKQYKLFVFTTVYLCILQTSLLSAQQRITMQNAVKTKLPTVMSVKTNRKVLTKTDTENNSRYVQNFDDKAAFETFMVVNKNNDECTWTYDSRVKAARYNNSKTLAADDWLLSPNIKLDNKHAYMLNFKYRAGFWSYTETFEVGIGTEIDTENYKIIVPRIETAVDSFQNNETEFTVKEDGDYRIGVHAMSKADQYYLFIDDISISEKALLAAPAATSIIDIKPGQQGTLTTDISFTTPTKAYDGSRIESLTKVEIYRNAKLITTFENPRPNVQLHYTDNSPTQGINQYSIIAYNNVGKGLAAVKETFVGIDIPAPPKDIILKESDNRITLAWKTPTEGAHNGYFDASTLSYNVYTKDGVILEKGIKHSEFIDKNIELKGAQKLLCYGVSAVTAGGESLISQSNPIVIGDSYTIPFHESFAMGKPTEEHFFWGEQNGENGFVFSTTHSYDDEYGCLEYLPKRKGDSASFNTGKIDVRNVRNPALMFTYFCYPGHKIKLKVIATSPQRTDTLAIYNYAAVGETKEWKKKVLLLDKFKNDDYVILKFLAESYNTAIPVYIDDINVINYLEYNVKAELRLVSEARVGKETMIGVKVTNMGSQPTKGMVATLYVEGEKYDEHECFDLPVNLGSMEFFYYEPKITDPETLHIYAVVSYSNDQDLTDNTTIVGTMKVKFPNFPRVVNLNGQLLSTNKAHLWWTKPIEAEGGKKEEDFENYEPWLTDKYGFWTTLDGDEGTTYGIRGLEFKHKTEPMAFMVFNPEELGVNVDEYPQFKPASGKQFLIAMSAQASSTRKGHNDDWLISPKLSGEAQTISFKAKNIDIQYPEKFEIRYSVTDKDTTHFVLLTTIDKPLKDWTQFQMALPKGTRYFAIHSIATDSYALMIDDIEYEMAPIDIIAYNIYMDKNKIGNTAGISMFEQSNVPIGLHSFQVSAVYDVGESALSNVINLDIPTTIVNDIQKSNISIETTHRQISIKAMPGDSVFIYTLDGHIFYSGYISNTNTEMSIPKGVYIIRVGNQFSQKVVVD